MTIPEPLPGASPAGTLRLEVEEFGRLIDALGRRGYVTVGPTRRDGAIVYDHISSASDLPRGWTDEQEAGRYRLKRRDDEALFGYAVGPHSLKRFLHPPLATLWRARRHDGRFELVPEVEPPPRYAFIGVRACDLAALDRLDDVLIDGPYVDHGYREARRRAFIVAVECASPGGTCFCQSMDTGPGVSRGADLVLTEVVDDRRQFFVLRATTPPGREVASELGCPPASGAEQAQAAAVVEAAEARMGRRLETRGLKEALVGGPEHPRWDHVAKRCLTCGSCTLSCPTCFCCTVEDAASLRGSDAERRRRWDTCFSIEFSYMYGGSVRLSPRARYRQWLTHKLGTWHDQFGVSGCVGCGRCITWCPVGIDITVEAAAIRETTVQPASGELSTE